MNATWCRLDNGDWGVRVEANLLGIFQAIEGQEIEVVTRAGVRSMQKITKVIRVLEPRPAKLVRGREVSKAILVPTAICAVEPRAKVAAPRKARSAQAAREAARAEWRERPLPEPKRTHVHVAPQPLRMNGGDSVNEFFARPAPGAEKLEDLLAKPTRLPNSSTLTRA